MIRRSPSPTRNYSILSNSVLTDSELTWEARGLLAYLLSKPDNWKVLPKALVKESPKAGRDKVYRMLEELKCAGYIVAEQMRLEGGQMGGMEYVVYDTPQEQEPELSGDFTVSGFAVSGSAVSGSAVSGESGCIVNTHSYKELSRANTETTNDSGESGSEMAVAEKSARKKREYTPEFEQLWNLYPRKTGRTNAVDAYHARVRGGLAHDEMLQAVINYARVKSSTPLHYLMHFSTFFGPHERWKDYLDGAAGILEADGSARTMNILQQFIEGD